MSLLSNAQILKIKFFNESAIFLGKYLRIWRKSSTFATDYFKNSREYD